jgi:hypothetical protein
MTRPLLLLLSAAVTAALLARSAAPVAACSCEIPSAGDVVSQAQLVLIGEPQSLSKTQSRIVRADNGMYEYGLRTKATIQVERYLKGRGPGAIEVIDDICVGSLAPDSLGRKHLLVLRFDDPYYRLPTVQGCLGSGPVNGSLLGLRLSQVEAVTGPGEPPDDSLAEPQPPARGGIPLGAAAAIGIAIPLAFLLGAAFLWPRRHSGS